MPRFPERDLALWVMKRLLVVGVPAALLWKLVEWAVG